MPHLPTPESPLQHLPQLDLLHPPREQVADLAGPWTEIGTLPGDGMTFTGHVELPDDPVDGPVKRAFFIAEAR